MSEQPLTKDTLRHLIAQFQEEQAQGLGTSRSPAQEQLRAATAQWLKQLLAQEGQEITPVVREAANWLYDYPGLPTVIADTLGIKLGRLRKLLARERQQPCSQCHTSVTVMESRNQGGYTPAGQVLCPQCEQKLLAARREREEEYAEERAAERSRQTDIEQRIMAAVRRGQAPWNTVPELRHHLVAYAVLWSAGATVLWVGGHVYAGVQGCQICGGAGERLFVAAPDYALSLESPDNKAWQTLGEEDEEGGTFAPSVYHALWRTNPHNYFAQVPLLPLLRLPLVLLCDQHAAIAEPHYLEIPVGEIALQRVNSRTYRATISATAEQYLLQQSEGRDGYWQVRRVLIHERRSQVGRRLLGAGSRPARE